MGKASQKAIITGIQKGSIAEELQLEPGDILLRINQEELRDVLDYYRLIEEENLHIEIMKRDGTLVVYEVEKDYDYPLGIQFEQVCFDGMKHCKNSCVFCFLKGLPKGLRKSLYVRDDDYRHSFLHGNYITLTNMTTQEIQRIIACRLSPIYISVHTTHPELRQMMLGNKEAGQLMDWLHSLADAGIDMHTQVVLCPGLNDGKELESTISDLVKLWPSVQSLAVVPVGLTRYNEGKHKNLRSFTKEESRAILAQLTAWQERLLPTMGTRFVFGADEFYSKAAQPLPPDEAYEGYPQLENGVGLLQSFQMDFADTLDHGGQSGRMGLTESHLLLTGASAYPYLADLLKKAKGGTNLTLRQVDNQFFGGQVSVTGLLTGSDIITNLEEKPSPCDILVISEIMLSQEEQLFLDGHTIKTVEERTGKTIKVLPNTGQALAELLLGGGTDE